MTEGQGDMSISHNELQGVHSRIDRVEGTLERFTAEVFPKFAADLSVELGSKFDNFAQRMDRGRPNILTIGTVIIAALTLAGGLFSAYGNLALSHVSSDVAGLVDEGKRQDARLEKLSDKTDARFQHLYENTMPVNEVKLRTESNKAELQTKLDTMVFSEYGKRVDTQQQNLLEAFRRFVDKTADNFASVNARLVGRDENKYHWDNEDKQVAGLQLQMDSIRRDFGSTYSLGDQLKNLQNQLNQQQSVLTQLLATQQPPREGR